MVFSVFAITNNAAVYITGHDFQGELLVMKFFEMIFKLDLIFMNLFEQVLILGLLYVCMHYLIPLNSFRVV